MPQTNQCCCAGAGVTRNLTSAFGGGGIGGGGGLYITLEFVDAFLPIPPDYPCWAGADPAQYFPLGGVFWPDGYGPPGVTIGYDPRTDRILSFTFGFLGSVAVVASSLRLCSAGFTPADILISTTDVQTICETLIPTPSGWNFLAGPLSSFSHYSRVDSDSEYFYGYTWWDEVHDSPDPNVTHCKYWRVDMDGSNFTELFDITGDDAAYTIPHYGGSIIRGDIYTVNGIDGGDNEVRKNGEVVATVDGFDFPGETVGEIGGQLLGMTDTGLFILETGSVTAVGLVINDDEHFTPISIGWYEREQCLVVTWAPTDPLGSIQLPIATLIYKPIAGGNIAGQDGVVGYFMRFAGLGYGPVFGFTGGNFIGQQMARKWSQPFYWALPRSIPLVGPVIPPPPPPPPPDPGDFCDALMGCTDPMCGTFQIEGITDPDPDESDPDDVTTFSYSNLVGYHFARFDLSAEPLCSIFAGSISSSGTELKFYCQLGTPEDYGDAGRLISHREVISTGFREEYYAFAEVFTIKCDSDSGRAYISKLQLCEHIFRWVDGVSSPTFYDYAGGFDPFEPASLAVDVLGMTGTTCAVYGWMASRMFSGALTVGEHFNVNSGGISLCAIV